MKHSRNVLLVFVLVLIDQLSKSYFIDKHIYIFKYFSFNYTINTGISFGFLKGYNLIFIIITFLVIFFVLYLYNRDPKYSLAFNFILAGAFGNLIDRIFRGHVVDFIDLRIWPIFNLADLFVTVGVLLLIYYLWREKS